MTAGVGKRVTKKRVCSEREREGERERERERERKNLGSCILDLGSL